MRKRVLQWSMLALSTALVLAVAEVGMRVVGLQAIGYGWGPLLVDRTGKRGSDPSSDKSSDFRILLLGDSQVGNRGTDPQVLPARILETSIQQELQGANGCIDADGFSKNPYVSVSTLGASGWGQDQQYLSLKEHIARLQPHLVLLWFTPENDLWNNAFPTHYPRNRSPKPTFVLDGETVVLVDRNEIHSDWLDVRLVSLGVSALGKVSRFLDQQVMTFPHLDELAFDPDGKWDREVLPPLERELSASDLSSIKEVDLAIFNPFAARDSLEIGKSHFIIGMDPGSPRVEAMVTLTAGLVAEIDHLAESNNARLIAFSYNSEKTNQPLYPPDGAYRYRDSEFVFSSDRMKSRLARIFFERSWLDLDLEIDNWRKPKNNPHLTTEANQALMKQLARRLIDQGMICETNPLPKLVPADVSRPKP